MEAFKEIDMASFRVGQRVRIVDASPEHRFLIGAEGQIVRGARIPGDWVVDIPTHPHAHTDLPPTYWAMAPCCLAPLTPPQADTWAESKVREVTRPVYTEPERVKEKA